MGFTVITVTLRVSDGLVLLAVFIAIWCGHWIKYFAPQSVVGKDGLLHRLLAYAYGAGWILAGFILWVAALWATGVTTISIWQAVGFLALDTTVAGLATIMAWSWDLYRRYQHLVGDRADYEQAIKPEQPRS